MNDAHERATTNRNTNDSQYADYASYADSVRDLALYLDARGYPFSFNSARDLVTYMQSKGYFTAPLEEYVNGVERALPNVAYL